MQITKTFEPIRSIYAPAVEIPYAFKHPFGGWNVHYGSIMWPSMSYWLVPGTESPDR